MDLDGSNMVKTTDECDQFLAHYNHLEKRLTRAGGSWFLPIRKAAIARFGELGFPTTKHEDWRQTNVANLARTDYASAAPDDTLPTLDQIDEFLLDGRDAARLVVVNGRFADSLSNYSSLPEGLTAGSLASAMASGEAAVEACLARYAGYQDEVFVALNTALLQDGVFIQTAKGAVIETPIQVLYLNTAGEKPLACHPRALIVAGASSQLTVVETYAAIGPCPCFNNSVTEIVAAPNSVIDHYKVVYEHHDGFHVGTLHLHQLRDSNVTSHAITMSGGLVRNNIVAVLDGEGCDCTLNGLYMLEGDDHVDNHLRVEHAKPHCNSWEYFKGVLDDRSRSVFTGRINVHKDAQKTNAKQTNMNLLLSDEALADSNPQLEIFADDVKCTHGATIGQVDAEAIFYLRSRGVSEEAARSLMVYAFVAESLDCIRIESLKSKMQNLLLDRLPQGDSLREMS